MFIRLTDALLSFCPGLKNKTVYMLVETLAGISGLFLRQKAT